MNASGGRILIVDDQKSARDVLCHVIRQECYEPLEANDGEQALAVIKDQSPDVLVLDCGGPGADGDELRRRARQLDPDLPVVTIAAGNNHNGHDTLLGPHDYRVRSLEQAELIGCVRQAMNERARQRTIRALLAQVPEAGRLRETMGASPATMDVCADVARVARSDFTVLINGETGTGKELVAQAIHQASLRASGPFIAVDCGAIPETLFESELFGHEKGAFTGAAHTHPGKFEAAKGGTLFLDEISNMPLGSQAKLLRALQERTVYRVGAMHPVKVDARVLVAASDDLETAAAKGVFRKDLLFRLNEFTILVPPLRQRKQDVVFLANQFLKTTNLELGKTVSGLSDSAAERLLGFDWPGNVRQLRSTIRRAVLLADAVVDEEHLGLPGLSDSWMGEPQSVADESLPLRQLVRRATIEVERNALLRTLRQTGWNKARAARLLQIDYKTMHNKLKEYGLRTPAPVPVRSAV
jgi:DNA-binding NtrC family response regulator